MKNSYGIYRSEAERVESKIHSISDIIEYFKHNTTSVSDYARPDVRKVFKSIFANASSSYAGININELKSFIKIFVINAGIDHKNMNALLPLLDYYDAMNEKKLLWVITSDPIIMIFRWLFPRNALESLSYTCEKEGTITAVIDSFVKSVDETICRFVPEYAQINQNLYSFLNNQAANPIICIKDFTNGVLTKFPDNTPVAGTGSILSEFLKEFRCQYEISTLPTVDGTPYSEAILNRLVSLSFEDDSNEIRSKLDNDRIFNDISDFVYSECLNFMKYAEINSDAISEWNPSEVSAVSIASILSPSEDWSSALEKVHRIAVMIFNSVNEYRNTPKENAYVFGDRLSMAVTAAGTANKDFALPEDSIGTDSKVYNWETIKESVDRLQCFYDLKDESIDKSFKVIKPYPIGARTAINGIGKISIVPATEASRYEKEGKGSTGKAAAVQGLEKTRRGIANATNNVKNGVYIPYKKYKNAEGAIDNQLAKITRGLKDAILNTNSAKYREEIIAGKTYSPISILKKVLVGYGVFCTSKVIFLVGLITRYYCGKKCKAKEKRKAINELDGEIRILDEKINDAQAAGDNKAKYELMRTRNSISSSREAIIANFDKNPDKYKETTRKALFNVEVNTNGKRD